MTVPHSFNCTISGRKLTIETGKFANQANAAVTVRYGDSVVLVTACVSPQPREGVDFLPLTVDYEERLYAAGKIPGGFIRREGRPSEEATLTSRLTDRPLRPLLPKHWRREIQLVITVLSADRENDPDVLSIIGGSAALSISEIPFYGPVGAVHVGYINGEIVLNPTMPQMEESALNLVVVSTKDTVVMLEAAANNVSDEVVNQAIEFGHNANRQLIDLQEDMRKVCGKPKDEVPIFEVSPELKSAVSAVVEKKLTKALKQSVKNHREEALSEIRQELVNSLGDSYSEDDILNYLDNLIKEKIRKTILVKGERVSGRSLDQVRPIDCEVGLLPRVHGSALFTRGETQVLTITTLGSIKKEQLLDGLGIEETKRFMHHYNFPPFSTGEVKRVGTPSRRSIGHGALAERALIPVMPPDNDFPYTIRLVSEVLSSSGSTSMASACASSLSLMDAGIPLKTPVAGISIGLVTGENGEYALLTDIEGLEDNYGDMDFKVAGTEQGITAIQMDTKIKGLSLEIIGKTLVQANQARLLILKEMSKAISTSRSEMSQYAPRMYKLELPQDKVGSVIGPGGKTIRSIIEETNTTVDINNDGIAFIGSTDAESAKKAIKMIENLIRDVEVGSIYTGKVTRIMTFGAFVEILPGKEGLVHISELADYRVDRVEDVVKVGDEITVKVTEIDGQGRINLSRQAVFEKTTASTAGMRTGYSTDRQYKKKRDFRSQHRQRPTESKRRHS
ncbi:MAG: polyribonucleotide nucleotidyltransferase [Dehalococcoidia bacterium]|nr:MAG: polyribonucleotide nucleotidyltransferase [Dehalococcoidia bacterium]